MKTDAELESACRTYLPKNEAAMLKLIDVKKLNYDVVWLRYEVKRK